MQWSNAVRTPDREWLRFAVSLDGPGFALFQHELTVFNRRRLEPSLGPAGWADDFEQSHRVLRAEGEFVEAVRKRIEPLVKDIPRAADEFLVWFERLRDT